MSEREHLDFPQYKADLRNLLDVTQDFRKAVAVFDADQREQKLFDQWSLKDVIAHFSAWAKLTVGSIDRAKTGEPIPMLLTDRECDDFNKDEVAARQNMSWDSVLEEFTSTEDTLLSRYQSLLEDEPNDTLVEFVTYCIGWDVEHYQGHLAGLTSVLPAKSS